MILLRRLEIDNAPQYQQRLFLTSLLVQIFQRILERPDREFLVGLLQKLPEANLLFPGRIGVAGQFLVGQAGPSRLLCGHLPIEEFAEQTDCLRSLIQGKAQIRRHLPHVVILRIVLQDQQVFRQCLGRLAFLQELFRLLDPAGDLDTIGVFRHWLCGAERPVLILGLPPPPSNAVPLLGDYESHDRYTVSPLHNPKSLPKAEIQGSPWFCRFDD